MQFNSEFNGEFKKNSKLPYFNTIGKTQTEHRTTMDASECGGNVHLVKGMIVTKRGA
jgi:hypothetical protein